MFLYIYIYIYKLGQLASKLLWYIIGHNDAWSIDTVVYHIGPSIGFKIHLLFYVSCYKQEHQPQAI